MCPHVSHLDIELSAISLLFVEYWPPALTGLKRSNRQQRARVDEGLGGEENLNWSPNFCICHVYDDHR